MLQLATDPKLDITASEADVPTHAEASRTQPPMSPAIDRLERHVKVIGEFLWG